MTFVGLILLVLKVSIALTVFALGLNSTFSNTTYLFRCPVQLVRALVSMNVLMPLLALILATSFHLHPAVKIAIVVIAVSPVPPMFPRKAIKAGSHEHYAIGLLVSTAILSVVLIPVTMSLLQAITDIPLQMPASRIAALVFTTVILPLSAGIGLNALRPAVAERIGTPTSKIATVLLVLSAIPVLFGASRSMLTLLGNGTLVTLGILAIGGLVLGRFLGGRVAENQRVLSLATASRHPAIAAAIAQTNFPNQKLAVTAIVLYLVVSGVVSALYLRRLERGVQAATQSTRERAA